MTKYLSKIIEYAYYALFLITPLLLTSVNYELFEFNKMLFVYGITSVIATSWILLMIRERRIIFRTTPLDIPLALFFIAHLVSSIYSIDPHISLWGYYGRFNGGVISIVSYLILFYAFISTIAEKTKHAVIFRLLTASLCSGLLVSLYAIAQHFGIDAHLWVQDVQNRVFSTLGQPNWLAAFTAILLPVSFSFIMNPETRKSYVALPVGLVGGVVTGAYLLTDGKDLFDGLGISITNSTLYGICFVIGILVTLGIAHLIRSLALQKTTILTSARVISTVYGVMFYITLLYTKSRSGFLAFWFINAVFWILTFIRAHIQGGGSYIKFLIGINAALIIVTVILGSPFPQLNSLTNFYHSAVDTQEPSSQTAEQNTPPVSSPSTELNITDSGDIRKLVWRGAWDATLERPWFGWGVETFAWIYYRFKPIEQNATSEWDFLYNKAHNEYLNYAATTGLVGLSTYLLIIGVFIGWFLKKLLLRDRSEMGSVSIGLFSGWLSLLITHFFGFSVVVTSVYFWVLPGLIVVLLSEQNTQATKKNIQKNISIMQWLGFGAAIAASLYVLWSIGMYWRADYFYADARSDYRKGSYSKAYGSIIQAIRARPFEPIYHDQLASILSYLALARYEQEASNTESDLASSSKLTEQAITASDIALQLSPGNVSFWKSRTRMFYTLSQIDESFATDAKTAVLEATKRAPNDPLIMYNVGIVYEIEGNTEKALESFKHALELKPDYKDAAWALAIFYEKEGNEEEAKKWLMYILEKIDPNDSEVKQKLEIE